MSAGAPNIAALLGGGGGPPGGQHTIQVRPPGPPASGDPVAALRGLAANGPGGGKVTVGSVIQDLHQLAGQTDDPQDKQVVLKALTMIQGIQVTEQKEKEAMLGTTPAHRGMARAASQGSGY